MIIIRLHLAIFLFFYALFSAQDDFITVYKPGHAQQINFPGRGTNFNINWEEIGYPQHHGSLLGITSTKEFLINFGTPQNPIANDATYRVKISNGNGVFNQIRFFDGDTVPPYNNLDKDKILDVSQWGNIQWQSFRNAFTFCVNLDISATDAPNLTLVSDAQEMFFLCSSLIGNASFNTWNTINLTNINSMFSAADFFNAPIGNWDVSNVTDFRYVFDMASHFNQPLRNWDTSSATTMEHMFHGASAFNNDIKNWDVSGVTNMDMMFAQTHNFNQNIGTWSLNSLTSAVDMLYLSGLDCQNYDNLLFGWNSKAVTPNNINLGIVIPLYYKHQSAIAARLNLMNSKNWSISGDNYNPQCNSILSTSENNELSDFFVYPNPTSDFLNLIGTSKINKAKIFDTQGRLILEINLPKNAIDVDNLHAGIYFLTIFGNGYSKTIEFTKK